MTLQERLLGIETVAQIIDALKAATPAQKLMVRSLLGLATKEDYHRLETDTKTGKVKFDTRGNADAE
jgi:hypothetical protein